MNITKLKQKIKTTTLSLLIAFAMLISANYSCFFTLANFAKDNFAAAIYSASEPYEYNFLSTDNMTHSVSDTSNSNYYIDRDADIIDPFKYVPNKTYFPIAKYNGVSALEADRSEITNLTTIDKLDNKYAIISTNKYKVAYKSYDAAFETVDITKSEGGKTTTETKNVVYVYANTSSNEDFADDSYKAKVTALTSIVSELNSNAGVELYKVIDPNKDYYDEMKGDFANIGTDSDAYDDISEDFDALTETVDKSLYSFKTRKTFEYKENKLSIKTNGTVQLTNNSYYVISCWVYTAGDATATLSVTSDNLCAEIENITTNGTWVQHYLFLETRAEVSSSITINLYYGDSDGVTGTQSMESFKGSNFSNGDVNYSKTMTGTVAFDGLIINKINQEEFINQTINGYTPNEISLANLAEGYTVANIKNNKKATEHETTTAEGKKEYSYTYEPYATYASEAALTVVDDASARYNANTSFANSFDTSFTAVKDQTNNTLVYNYKDATNLDYETYAENGTNYFTYYVPRYLEDNKTSLTTSRKQAYRDRYQNKTLTESTKYGFSQLQASVVQESTEFEAYEKDKFDEFGNNVTTKDENDKDVNVKLENQTNNTFINSKNEQNYILKLQNTSSYELGLTTPKFVVASNAYYRVSVWAYSSTKDATATAKLFSTITERDSLSNGTLVLATNSASDFEYNDNDTNGWKEIVFFVKGNPYSSYEVYLSLLASANDTVYFDNIRIENISSSSYASGSTKLDLAGKGILTSNVNNGLFNNIFVGSEDPVNTYPYKPETNSWKVDDKQTSEKVVSGIISTNPTAYNTLKVPAYNNDGELDYLEDDELASNEYVLDYAGKAIRVTTVAAIFGNVARPKTTVNDLLTSQGLTAVNSPEYNAEPYTNNVYAVYLPSVAAEETKPSFYMDSKDIGSSSSSTSLSSNKIYKLTFQAWLATGFTGTLVANLKFDDKNISNIEVNTANLKKEAWHTFTFYIRTGNTSRSSVNLQLGAKESVGTLFFQNVNHMLLEDNDTQTANEQFETLLANNNAIDLQNRIDTNSMSKIVRFVDMQNNNFTMHSTEQNAETHLYESYSYKQDELKDDAKVDYTQGTVAVVDTSLANSFVFNSQEQTVTENPKAKAPTALLLKNELATDYTVAKSTFSTTLSSSKWYEISFYAKTSDLGEKGLNVSVNGLSVHFDNINTSAVAENSGWVKYTVYAEIGSSSISTLSLQFTLGNDNGESFTGWALISDISIDEIEEEAYTTAFEDETLQESDTVKFKSTVVAKEEDSESDEDKSNFNWTTFFLVFSSILLVVSLVIALVAVVVKRKQKANKDIEPQEGIKKADTPDEGGIQ